jgi:hypothetical protein
MEDIPAPQPNSEIDEIILRQLDEITQDAAGRRVLTIAQLDDLATETRLVLILDSSAHYVYITDRDVFGALKKEFYSEFDGKRGGLTFAAYDQYARGSKLIAEAAQRHRDFVAAGRR